MTGIAAAIASSCASATFEVLLDVETVSGTYDGEFAIGLTDFVTATTEHGSGAVSYAWARVSGSTALSISPSATASSVQFVFSDGLGYSAVWRVTATDSLGRTAQASVTVSANGG